MIEVIKTGIYSTIQDQGRFGYRNIGVPVSGAMDITSVNLANSLLDNHLNCAVLETTYIGPILKFHIPTYVVITGADCYLKLNDRPINLNTVIFIKKGDQLSIGKATTGVRNYLAVAGGIQTQKILNSRSFYKGITQNESINKGMFLAVNQPLKNIINRTSIVTNNEHFDQKIMTAFNGPEYNLLSKQTQMNLWTQEFKISDQSNRMAYKLTGTSSLCANEIITSSVQPGTIQLTPSGKLIILMRDCQTTGGYARVLQLSNSSINKLSQKTPNSKIYFFKI